MSSIITLDMIKKNILELEKTLDNSILLGISDEVIRGIQFSVSEVLKGTDITIESIKEEDEEGFLL